MAIIKQHEPLRVPQGWKDQDRALVIQIEHILDDIYKRFGQLTWEDLGKKLQERITDIAEGAVTAVTWDSVNKKLTVTINDTVNDVVTIATIKTALNLTKSDVGLGNVENKSSATIRSELTSQNVTDALGYTPPTTDTKNTTGTTNKTGTKLYIVGAETQATNPQTNSNSKVYIGTDNCLYSNNTKVLTAHQDISGKADIVSGATNGNFAALDANGNLKDSGHKHSDYLTSHQDISGKVDGPASATNNAVALFSGTTGKVIQNSSKTITDATSAAAMNNNANIPTNRKVLNSYYNGLDATSAGYALDARQGKALNCVKKISNSAKTKFTITTDNTINVKNLFLIMHKNSVIGLSVVDGAGNVNNLISNAVLTASVSGNKITVNGDNLYYADITVISGTPFTIAQGT